MRNAAPDTSITPLNLSPIIFGLTGKKHSGKDTVGELIHDILGNHYPCFRMAFADEVKLELARLTNGDVKTINKNKDNPRLRKILQYLGTEVCREEDSLMWIKLVNEKVQSLIASNPEKRICIYFTDVRFLNEADYVKSLGGILFKIQRVLSDYKYDEHASETEQDKIKVDYLIDNSMPGLHRLKWEVKATLGYINDRLKLSI